MKESIYMGEIKVTRERKRETQKSKLRIPRGLKGRDFCKWV